MNSRPWPTTDQITPVNTGATTDSEIQQNFAALNSLINQFNQLVTLEGGLAKKIQSLANQLKALRPYDGVYDAGYIDNAVLKNWPNAHFLLDATINGSLTNVIDVSLAGTPYTTFSEVAGTVTILGGTSGGTLFLDSNLSGIRTVTTGDLLVLSSAGNDVLTFTPGGTPTTVFSADAGPMTVLGGKVYLDGNSDFGMAINSTNLELGAGTGKIISTAAIQPGGYCAVDGTPASGYSENGILFKDGLFISGAFGSVVPTGVVGEVASDAFYVRSLTGGTQNEEGVWTGTWQDLSVFLPGVVAGSAVAWTGSQYLTTLGTIATGKWQGTRIDDAYIVSAVTWNAKQASLGTGSAGQYLANGPAWEALNPTAVGLSNVTNDAQIKASVGTAKGDLITFSGLSTPVNIAAGSSAGNLRTDGSGNWSIDTTTYLPTGWAGSLSVTTVGTITSGTWHGNTIDDTYLTSMQSTAPFLKVGWTGASSLVTVGAISPPSVTCSNFLKAAAANITFNDGSNHYLLDMHFDTGKIYMGSTGFTQACYFDTSTGITYPNRLVLPSG